MHARQGSAGHSKAGGARRHLEHDDGVLGRRVFGLVDRQLPLVGAVELRFEGFGVWGAWRGQDSGLLSLHHLHPSPADAKLPAPTLISCSLGQAAWYSSTERSSSVHLISPLSATTTHSAVH